MGFYRENEDLYIETRFRIQYSNHVTFEGVPIFSFKKLEREVSKLIAPELKDKYSDYFYFTSNDFYDTEYDFFFREIKTELELEEFIEEFVKWLEYHEKEVFPKLLDIRSLAEYVGSVSFDKKLEAPVAVGGKFPVHLFKKLAILKWGNQTERYEEYKENTKIRIEKYAIEKPDRYNPAFKEGFESLISHLENEPNPFL
ncbi:hypothetical protein EDL99_06470 [Ornithobacterium rhinotracheale]|uniref:hypothetical protein n=1 Tax=Ornithobacterium rhinotracheale TaxID=28251 RepID=UPI00129C3E44|nr:hypothetical protein [Ornithobacterium rhinotracheale]MRJ08509.1 hypothetical protein [Ornithobacterium rhinotracheale]UOH76784.1 hypothetical protein MT996_06035 [Ornithobacterium rhinotracheale]